MIEMRSIHLRIVQVLPISHDYLGMEPLPYTVMFYIELKLRMRYRFSGVCTDKLLTLGGQFRIYRTSKCKESVGHWQLSAPNSRKLFTPRSGFAKGIACLTSPWTREDRRDDETHLPDTDEPWANAPIVRVYLPISSQHSQLSWKFLFASVSGTCYRKKAFALRTLEDKRTWSLWNPFRLSDCVPRKSSRERLCTTLK
jgi:hypothetical protein